MARKLLCALLMSLLVISAAFAGGKTETGKPVQLQLITGTSGDDQKLDLAAAELFNKAHPGVQVKVEFYTEDYMTKLQTLIAAGSPPDLSWLSEAETVSWGIKGLLADLAPMYKSAKDIKVGDYVTGSVFAGPNGELWGVSPGGASIIMYYNKKLFKDAGIVPPMDPANPWTWAQYVENAKKLTTDVNGKHPTDPGFDYDNVKVWGTLMPSQWVDLLPMLETEGLSFGTKDGKGLRITDPKAIKVVQDIADLAYVDRVAPKPAYQKALPGMIPNLIQGQVAMYMHGTWHLAGFGGEKFDFGVMALPRHGATPRTIIWGAPFVLYKASTKKAEAFEYLKFVTDPETNIGTITAGALLPNKKDWYTDPAKLLRWTDNPAHGEDFRKVVVGSILTNAVLGEQVLLKNFIQVVQDTIMPALDPVWLGEKTAAEALGGMEDRVKANLQGVWSMQR